MSSSEIEFVECSSSADLEAAQQINDLIPTKSSKVYRHAYDKFIAWCDEKQIENYSENVLLAYFAELAKKMNWKSSTMFSQYSMLKSLLKILNGVDISSYLQLRAYLKKQNQGYAPKKSRVLSKAQFDKFIIEASDEKYLDLKIVLVIGIFGACACDELVKLKVHDIKDLGATLYVKIPDNKTKKTRSFTVIGEEFLRIYRKYVSLRPKDMVETRFLIKYKNGKCYRQVMGIHKIGGVAREVATYLNLPYCKEYTGHCLRRTSATLLVDIGADITFLEKEECS